MLGEVIKQINNATGDTPTATKEIYKWNQMSGQKASSSGTIYGIYDLSGGLNERTAAYTANNDNNLTRYGKSLLYKESKTEETSTKYTTVYAHDPDADKSGEDLNIASQKNYEMEENKRKFGNAISETSKAGTGKTSWYKDNSYFVGINGPFSVRGGIWYDVSNAGLCHFYRTDGPSSYYYGFRVVLVGF